MFTISIFQIIPTILQVISVHYLGYKLPQESKGHLSKQLHVDTTDNSPHGLEHQTEMVLVKEVSEQANTMELIVRICLVQLLQNPQLLQSCLVHHLVVADDLDGHLLVGLEGVSRPHHIAEYPLAGVAVHRVPSIQLLANTHT